MFVRSVSMAVKSLVLLISQLALYWSGLHASEYMIKPNKPADLEEFDGITISLLKGAKYCDRTTKIGDRLKVYYNASLTDGTLIESNFGTGKPLEVTIGDGQVILGWENGLQDMCVGEIRYLTIPSKYAYGEATVGARFPARATLNFVIELIGFDRIPGAPHRSNIFARIDGNNDGMLSKEEVTTYLRREGIKDRPGEEGFNRLLQDIFVEEDRNSDGLITFSEFGGTKHDEL